MLQVSIGFSILVLLIVLKLFMSNNDNFPKGRS